MHRFVTTYFSENRSFKLVLNPKVKIVVMKVRILRKQGNNMKVTGL